MLAWVNSFLTDRTVQVKINNTYSEILIVQNGTPQGSCISPTLFNIMVNDLSECIKYSAMSQFADDSAIWLSGSNLNFIQNRMQEDLSNIYLWCEKWGFLLSPNKTLAIIFTRKRKLGKLILKIGDTIINIVKEVKFLGMILDDKLTWLIHIQYVEGRCSKVINCMKLLSGTRWGANSYTLRNIYIALIRSKIDYGCELYNTASHSTKKILDRIQSQALRICTGAYKNVSTCSLQVEMGDPPLEERRKCLITKSYLNILSHEDNHPAKKSLKNAATFLVHKSDIKKKQKPYYIVANDMLDQHNIDSTLVYRDIQFPTSPWHLLKPTVNTQLTRTLTKRDSPHILKSEGNILIDTQYNNYLKIYTDGSKDPENNSSCAYVIPEFRIKKGYKLPKHLSIFMCELTAIFLALTWIEEFKPLNVVIFVDSLSALQAISGSLFKIEAQIIYDIYFLYTSLTKQGINIILKWIPSHVSISGNELADQEAKKALQYYDSKIYVPLYKEDIKTLCRNILKCIWQENWNDNPKGRTLYAVKDTVSFKISIPRLNREWERHLFKVRCGYININKYLSTLGKSRDEKCDKCQETDNVYHFIFNCTKYSVQRNILLETLNRQGVTDLSLNNLLTGSSLTFQPVLRYLVETGVLYR